MFLLLPHPILQACLCASVLPGMAGPGVAKHGAFQQECLLFTLCRAHSTWPLRLNSKICTVALTDSPDFHSLHSPSRILFSLFALN